jgi:hypothetical protein
MKNCKLSLLQRYLLIGCYLLIGLTILSSFFQTNTVFAGDDKLNEMANKVAHSLIQETGASSVYLNIQNFQNSVTHEIPILSIQLYNQLQAAMTEKGFSFAEDPVDAKYFIACDFQPSGDKVIFFFKYYKTNVPNKFKTIKSTIEIKDLRSDAFTENLETKALKISSRLLDNPAAFRSMVLGNKKLKVFINPIVESNYKYQSDFSENFLNQIKSQLIKSDTVQIIEPKPVKIRTRGFIEGKTSQIKSLETSDAVLADADAVMDGRYYIGINSVNVDLKIRAIDGTVLGSAEEKLPRSIIRLSLDNPAAEQAAEIADVQSQHNDEALVKITTDKGGEYQTYYENETITFMLQVARPLYVYVYDINSKNEVEFIYPKSNTNAALIPGELYTIPSENDDWEIVASPPFGLDNVVIFACEKRLPLPRFSKDIASVSFNKNTRGLVRREKKIALAGRNQINPLDLVEYFRGAALIQDATLYKDNIMITTMAR